MSMVVGPPKAADTTDIIDVLGPRLAEQRLCTQVAIELGAVLDEYLPAEGELIAVVAADLVARWTALGAGGLQRPRLFGPDGFVASYLAAVEHDDQGRPHRAFCMRGDVVGGRLVDRRSYGIRVWSHHARWLSRMAALAPGAEAVGAGQVDMGRDKAARVHRELVVESWRTQVGAALAPLVWESLGQDRDKVAAVVHALVAAWLASGGPRRQALTGPFGFVDTYFSGVSYVRTPEGEERFRPEFLPDVEPDDRSGAAAYEQAVWGAHIAELAAAR